MKIRYAIASVFAIAASLALTIASTAHAADWTEGKNYFLVTPPRPTSVGPGKVEVTEVFSYACPACNVFLPTMHKLIKALPANAVVTYVPASFNAAEDWPMFQLAFCTAQALGIAEQNHDALFDAVWTTNELAVIDPATHGIKSHVPTIEDAAKFYSKRSGVPVEKFLSTSKSFAVDLKVRTAEDTVMGFMVDRTPTLIVNGKYRLQTESAGGYDQLIDLVKYLVAKESK